KYYEADLKVDYIEYSNDDLEFGALHLVARTSLGHIDIGGRYQGRNLYINNLVIDSLDTEEIEQLFADDNSSDIADESNSSDDESPSIFIPQKLFVEKFKANILPRDYQGIHLSLFDASAKNLNIDIDNDKLLGKFSLDIVTDIARAEVKLSFLDDLVDIDSIKIKDIDLTKVIAFTEDTNSSDGNSSKVEKTGSGESLRIPYIPNKINISKIVANTLPTKLYDIEIDRVGLIATNMLIDISKELIESAAIEMNIESELARLEHTGSIKNNTLKSHIKATLEDKIIDKYELPLRKGALTTVSINASTNTDKIEAKLSFEAKELLDAQKDEFNLDIKPSNVNVKYVFDTAVLAGNLESAILTPYTKNAVVNLDFWLKDKFGYKGTISSKGIERVDPKISSMIKDLNIDISGDLDQASANIDSRMIAGKFSTSDFQKGKLNLKSKQKVDISKFVKLPKELQNAKASFLVDAPIDFNNTFPIFAKAKILSNVANVNADIKYDDALDISGKLVIPKDTLLKGFDKNIRFDTLSPMHVDFNMIDDDVAVKLKSKKLNVSAKHNLKSGTTTGNINLNGSNVSIKGSSKKNISVNLSSSSIQSTLKAVGSIYKIDLPDINGDISLQGDIEELSSASLSLSSSRILIGKDKKNGTVLKNLSLFAKGDKNGVSIKNYRLETQGVKIYSTKPSRIDIKDDKISVSPIWINDSLKAIGEYNLKTKKGKITASASEFKVSHDLADIISMLNIKTNINGDKVSINGVVHIKSGNIKYNMNQKSFAADSDIVVLQRQRKKNNEFERNFSVDVKVDSNEALTYKMNGISISMKPDLSIKKSYGSSLRAYGKIELLKGGYYTFEDKKFVLKKSNIYFKGKPDAPILNINIVYRHVGTTINVKVSGTASEPSLHFSSDPHMSREQILSFIMFDTGSGGRDNKAGDVTNLVAGSLVKSLFSSMGLKLDHLVLSGSGFEVGKKISDKITIIYDQEEKSSIKVRIENTKNIETDISFGSNSRSVDIFYKKEF
ncbi:MAG: hypothetical protein HF962_06020, partial [Sulfurovum sp.]|nr:hypothetical protein [Sulfurovum sp.]